MVNTELLKLLEIVGGGLIIGGIGQIILIKKRNNKKKEELEMAEAYNSNSYSNSEIQESEKIAKKYIEDYKLTYPKDSIKSALINNGNSENDVENWINKYFN